MIVEVDKDRGYLFDKNNNEIKLVIWANLVTTKFYDSPLRFERFESL